MAAGNEWAPKGAPLTASVAPATVLGCRVRTVRLAAWAVCGAMSLAIFLLSLASDATAVGAALLLLLLAAVIGLLVGVGLLILGYRDFFSRRRGVALWFGLLWVGVAVSRVSIGSAVAAGATTVVLIWAMVGGLMLGPTLVLYLVRTDHSLRVWALTMLAFVWLLYSVGLIVGWDELLRRLTFPQPSPVSGLMQTLVCLTIWVFFAAPVAFLWSTGCLLRREAQGVATTGLAASTGAAAGDAHQL